MGRATTQATNFSGKNNEHLYLTDWLYNTIVQRLTDKLVQNWGTPKFDAPFPDEKGLNEHLSQLRFKYRQAQIQALIDGEAYILALPDDGREWDQPIDYNNIKSIYYSCVYDITQMSPDPSRDERDIYNPTYYDRPLFIRGVDGQLISDGDRSIKIHKDRVRRFIGQWTPVRSYRANSYRHTSYFEILHDTIEDYHQATRIIKQKIKDIIEREVTDLAGFDDENVDKANEKVTSRILETDVLKIISHDENEALKMLDRQLQNVSDIFEKVFQTNVLGACGLSGMDVFSHEPKGLGNTGKSQMMTNASNTRLKQSLYWGENINEDLKLLSGFYGYKGSYSWEWTSTYESTPEEQARIKQINANTDKVYVDSGSIDPEEVRDSRFGTSEYGEDIILNKTRSNDRNKENNEDDRQEENKGEEKQDAVKKFEVQEDDRVILESEFSPIGLEDLQEV